MGQPAPHTHPHLIGENEVTPFIKKDEYQCRRQKLVEAIVEHSRKCNSQAQNHMVNIHFWFCLNSLINLNMPTLEYQYKDHYAKTKSILIIFLKNTAKVLIFVNDEFN